MRLYGVASVKPQEVTAAAGGFLEMGVVPGNIVIISRGAGQPEERMMITSVEHQLGQKVR